MKTLNNRKDWKIRPEGITIWDNFFTPEALKILKYRILYTKYCDDDYGKYKATNHYKDQDYMSEIIASELSTKLDLPPFQKAWSVIYDNYCDGVSFHCDGGWITLNIWLSDDKSVKDPSKNGFTIYDKIVPPDWNKDKWNGDRQDESISDGIEKWLKDNEVKPVHVPFKSNRATLFNGAHFHKTDGVSMKDGPENRRVSYTMIFGVQLKK
jgi:hypothetical protein